MATRKSDARNSNQETAKKSGWHIPGCAISFLLPVVVIHELCFKYAGRGLWALGVLRAISKQELIVSDAARAGVYLLIV
ncbi:MAG TPA: hypothetical protein VGB77_11805, partial [Abditibacteriaceae bacterium]